MDSYTHEHADNQGTPADGAIREVPSGTTPLDIANDISPRLAAASIVARLIPLATAALKSAADDEPTEAACTPPKTRRPAPRGSLDAAHRRHAPGAGHREGSRGAQSGAPLGRARDGDAVLELFPETKLGHGPATENGFFYDFYRETPFTPDDLARIEAKMAEVVARNEPFVREHEPREKALAEFEKDGDFMKTHFVTKFTEPGSEVSFYRNGKFLDFCRGPHVPSTAA